MRRLPLEAAQTLLGGPRHQLRRVYTERDLIALGLGTTFGVGVMKYAGPADLLNAGPATIVSCAIAGVVILLCGLCFAKWPRWPPSPEAPSPTPTSRSVSCAPDWSAGR
jgi:hypothetical protein